MRRAFLTCGGSMSAGALSCCGRMPGYRISVARLMHSALAAMAPWCWTVSLPGVAQVRRALRVLHHDEHHRAHPRPGDDDYSRLLQWHRAHHSHRVLCLRHVIAPATSCATRWAAAASTRCDGTEAGALTSWPPACLTRWACWHSRGGAPRAAPRRRRGRGGSCCCARW